MKQEDILISFGFDKYGDADFGVRGDIGQLSLEQMNKLRAMIPVGIWQAEDMFSREHWKRLSANIAGSEK